MATYLENLTTTRDNIAAQLADMSENPKPDYSKDGQSVSWAQLFKMLSDQLNTVNNQIAAAQPYEIVTEGY